LAVSVKPQRKGPPWCVGDDRLTLMAICVGRRFTVEDPTPSFQSIS